MSTSTRARQMKTIRVWMLFGQPSVSDVEEGLLSHFFSGQEILWANILTFFQAASSILKLRQVSHTYPRNGTAFGGILHCQRTGPFSLRLMACSMTSMSDTFRWQIAFLAETKRLCQCIMVRPVCCQAEFNSEKERVPVFPVHVVPGATHRRGHLTLWLHSVSLLAPQPSQPGAHMLWRTLPCPCFVRLAFNNRSDNTRPPFTETVPTTRPCLCNLDSKSL